MVGKSKVDKCVIKYILNILRNLYEETNFLYSERLNRYITNNQHSVLQFFEFNKTHLELNEMSSFIIRNCNKLAFNKLIMYNIIKYNKYTNTKLHFNL